MSETPETTEIRHGRRALDRRTVMGIAIALVALLVVVWFLFLRSSGEPEPAAAPAPAPAPAPTSEPAPEEPAPERQAGGPVETFQMFAPRDPFEPLVSADTTGTTGDEAGAPVDGAVVTANPNTAGAGDATGAVNAGGSSVGGHTVSVIDVFAAQGTPQAQVEVDGTVYRVSEGERFADSFQLLSASGECAGMLFGDDQFTLCEGEEILK